MAETRTCSISLVASTGDSLSEGHSIGSGLEDAAAVVSVSECGPAGGKLSVRAVMTAEQPATSPAAHAITSNEWAGLSHAVVADSDSCMQHMPAQMLQDMSSNAQNSLPQSLIQQQEQISAAIGYLDVSAAHTAAPAADVNHAGRMLELESPAQQHVTWDPGAVLLPGTSDDNVAFGNGISPAIQQRQEPMLQLLVQDQRQNPTMRLSNSCGSLSTLDFPTGSASMGAGRSRLGRLANPASNSTRLAATAADYTAAAALSSPLGGAEDWRCPEPGLRKRSVAGGVGDEHSGAGQWHSSNWALERSASNCSLGSDDGTARRLRIHCMTFNMGSKVPSSLPPDVLGLSRGSSSGGAHSIPPTAAAAEVDLYVFATQESGTISEWEQLISSNLPAGAGYERLAWQTLRAIHLVMYASPRFRKQVLAVRGSAVATGIGNVVGNKGAVALSIQLVDMKLLFIGSHFAAHDDKVERRNADYARIKAGLFTSHSYGSLADLAGSSSSNLSELSSAHSTRSSPILFSSLLRTTPRPCSNSGSPSVTERHEHRPRQQQQQQSACSPREQRATSASPRAWLSGLWRPCITPVTASSSGAAHAHVASINSDVLRGSESARRAHGNALDTGTEVSMLRATSCPSVPGAGSSSLRLFNQQQEAGGHEDHIVGSHPIRDDSLHATGHNTALMTSQLADSPDIPSSPASPLGVDGVRRQISFFDTFDPVSKQNRDSLARGSRSLTSSGDIMADHDVVFWVGDLNYRINGNPKAVGFLLQRKLDEVLHANDQLRLQQKKGRVFQGFDEGKIHFPPTFKYLPGTCDYSEQRVPSWTDRILWKIRPREPWEDNVAPTVTQLYYISAPEVVSSDHKPVVAGFDLVMAPAEVPSVQVDNTGLGSRCAIM